MNPSLSSFVVESACRAIRVEYDPDNKSNNNPSYLFKTLDPTLTKGDFVVVPTITRHGMTVVKIVEVDMIVNYDSNDNYQWIIGKVDKTAFDSLLAQDSVVINKIARIEQEKKKRELLAAMGIADGDVPNYEQVAIAAPSAPARPAPPVIEPIKPQRHTPRTEPSDDIPF